MEYTFTSFQKEVLEKGDLKVFTLVHGEEEYLFDALLSKLKEKFPRTEVISGSDLDPETLADRLRGSSLFAPVSEKVVVIKDFDTLLKGLRKKKAQLLEKILKGSPTKVVAIVRRKLDKKDLSKEPLKNLLTLGDTVTLSKVSAQKVAQLVKRRFEREGKKITDEALKRLLELCGTDLAYLKGEVEKILLFVEGKEVRKEHVEKVCFPSEKGDIFSFVDAFLGGDLDRSLREVKALIRNGLHPLQIESVLATYLLRLRVLQELIKRGKKLEEAFSIADVKNKFAQVKFKGYLKSVNEERVKRMISKLSEFDLKVKVSFQDPEKALLDFVVASLR